MAANTSKHLAFRYGYCVNEKCEKSQKDAKGQREIQQIASHKPLVCSECQKALHECPPPKSGGLSTKQMAMIAGAVILLALIGLGINALLGDSKKPEPIKHDKTELVMEAGENVEAEVTEPETPAKEEPEAEKKEEEPKQPTTTTTITTQPKQPQNGQGTINLSYGKYSGGLKNGQPDGTGKLTFTRSYQLNSEYTAQPGEYVQGIFENGKPSFVTYYKNDGTVVKIKLR